MARIIDRSNMTSAVYHGRKAANKQILSNYRPMIEMTIPSSLDPTLAPEGHHVVLLFTQYTPYNLADGKTWTDAERNKYADTG